VDYPKSTPSIGLVNGKFVDENPVSGSPGSLIPAVWGNAVTEELLNVVQAGGLEPVEAEHDQLLKAIRTIIQSSLPPEQIRTTLAAYGITDAYTKAEVEALFKNATALPVGAMMAFPKGTVPAGFLEVDGSVQSIATYPDLAAYLGTTFNKGDEGAGNFRLPESRGEFLRGWDHGRGVDTGRDIGTFQSDAFKSHTHEYDNMQGGGARNSVADTVAAASNATTETGHITSAAGGTETRPRNLSVMWCIKAWNAPVSQGSIDVAALAADVQTIQKIAVVGAFKRLTASANGLSSVVNVAADQLVVGNDASFRMVNGVNLSVNATAMGANGLDTGTLTASTWYSVWVIWGEQGVAGLLSLSANSPVLPVGFTHKARVTWARTDSTANKFLLSFVQAGNSVQYKVSSGSNVPNLPVMASGTVSPAADVSVSAFVPPTASKIALAAGSTGSYISFAPSSAYSAQVTTYLSTTALNAAPFVGGYNPSSPVPTANGLILLEGNTVRFGSSGGTGVLQCLGWEDSL